MLQKRSRVKVQVAPRQRHWWQRWFRSSRNASPSSPSSPSSAPTAPRVKVLIAPHLKPSPPELEAEPELENPVKVLVAPREPLIPRRIIAGFCSALLWLALAGGGVASAWMALRLLVAPHSVAWVPWLVTDQQRTLQPLDAPQSLEQIRDRLTDVGMQAGDAIPLQVAGAETGDLLLPVLGQHSRCLPGGRLAEHISTPSDGTLDEIQAERDCWQIVELRVYSPVEASQGQLRLRDRLAVSGVPEFIAMLPLVDSGYDYPGTSQSLSLTTVQRIPGNASPLGGDWLQLQGSVRHGSVRLVYGQVVYYDPRTHRLSLLTQWSSPAGAAAQWQQVTGDETPELVVNQSLGLEPSFQVWQAIAPGQASANGSEAPTTTQLQEISLEHPALDHGRYRQAIAFAQAGLWSPALALIEQESMDSSTWTGAAQAQRDLIALHATVTRRQAERIWGSSSQKVTALLMDGQWAEALRILQTDPTASQRLTTLLRDETGQLWTRIETALRVTPHQRDVQAWAMLVVAQQSGRQAAIAWLEQQLSAQNSNQPANNDATAETTVTIADLTPPLRAAIVLLDSMIPSTVPLHTSHILGSVTPLNEINPADWWPLGTPAIPALPPGQSWYQVIVSGFFDGQQWQQAPFTAINLTALDGAYQLRQRLGLPANAPLHLIAMLDNGTMQVIPGTVQGIQATAGAVQLLVRSAPVDTSGSQLLATTPNTLSWLDQDHQITLTQLRRQHPALAATILPELRRLFEIPSESPTRDGASEPIDLGEMADWTVHLQDLNGNGASDVILLFEDHREPAAAANAPATASPASASTTPQSENNSPDPPRPQLRILVLSERSEVIYSNLQEGNGYRAAAIANLGVGTPPVLVLANPPNFTLRRWSSEAAWLESLELMLE